MRRSPLPRRIPLSPGQKPLRRTPLVSGGKLGSAAKGMKRSELVSKRPTVTPEERRARKLVKARALNLLCERCGSAPGMEWCHRLARSQGGLWCPSNGWLGCTPCHSACHASPAVAYEQGWHVRSTQNPATVPMWMAGRGYVLLRPDGSVAPYESSAA